MIGEFGGRSVGNDAEGIWQRRLVSYLQSNGFDYTYWCWNPNSGDTGGVLEDNWTTLNPAKLAILRAYQWPPLGSPEPAAAAQAIIAAFDGPSPSPPAPTAPVAPPSTSVAAGPGGTFAIGGPFDPDPNHVLLGAGGQTSPPVTIAVR